MSKTLYEVLPGVEFVNGTPVPSQREVRLTEAEARFDVQMGRISLKATPTRQTQRQTQKKNSGSETDDSADALVVADETLG